MVCDESLVTGHVVIVFRDASSLCFPPFDFHMHHIVIVTASNRILFVALRFFSAYFRRAEGTCFGSASQVKEEI
jgi:hypothetical protein